MRANTDAGGRLQQEILAALLTANPIFIRIGGGRPQSLKGKSEQSQKRGGGGGEEGGDEEEGEGEGGGHEFWRMLPKASADVTQVVGVP
jgi:hypothetical protein